MVSVFPLVLHVLLPRACLACGNDLPFDHSEPLCPKEILPPPPSPACVRCGGALGAGRVFCHACSGRLFSCRLIRAACAHRGAAASLVHAFKFRGFPCAAQYAGKAMAREFPRFAELNAFDALVPVPLHPRREKERGYNQAERIAREISEAARRPLFNLLERRRGANPSWRLGKSKRKTELAGAFAVQEGKHPQIVGRRFLLIDDVCASGTTFEECAQALRAAGAADVCGYAFTRAGSFT